jgi:DNA-binding HxlR family transcriptional regulator
MSLPSWISEKLGSNRKVNTKLTERHVVETMYEAERPLFSIQQLQQRIKPDVSKVTIRDRLTDLEERGIVATETYSDSLTLYYLDHPESEWPLSPEGKRALEPETEPAQNPLSEFVRHPRVQQVLREELWRSVAWAGFGLFGWAILISSSDQLAATVWTVGGLPILTWATLTVGMIGLRLTTGGEFQVQTTDGLQLVALGGVVLGGFWGLFLILVLDWSPLLVAGLYGVILLTSLVYYLREIRPDTDSLDAD